jgi:PAS domain S-box-containing protein
MASWFLGQTDYLFFVYGLAFFGLGVVSYLLSREVNQRLPWIWLALFGFSHAVHEWLDLMPQVWQAAFWLMTCRRASLALSFLFLAEFGRLSLVRQWGRGPGRWLLGVLALMGCLGGWWGWSGLGATTRYTLGLVGSLSAGLALYGEARRPDFPGRGWLTAGGLGFILYGLATGLVVPPAPFFPASALNFHTFTNLTGLPVEVLRAILAVAIAAMSLGYIQSLWSAEFLESRRYRVRYLHGMVTALVVILAAGWLLTQTLGHLAKERIQKDTASHGNLIIQRLTFELEEAEAAAKAMAGSPGLSPALVSSSPETIALANAVLDRYQSMFGASPAYIMDRTGTTVTSSNRDTPGSFAGHNFAFRPYFQEAIKGLPGRYFALGSLSHKPGFFAAYPVLGPDGKIVGVAIIKTEMDKFQQMLRGSDPAFLLDPDGIIFLSSRPSLVSGSLWPVTPPVAEIGKSQFGARDFIPIFSRPQTDGAEVEMAGQTFLFARQYLDTPGTTGWSLVLLASHGQVVFYRLLGIATTLMVIMFTLLAAGSNLYIREGANRIIASEARFRAMFDAAPEAVLVFDTETRKIVDVNPFMARWLGYSPEELVNLKVDQLLAVDSLNEDGLWECAVGLKPTSSQRYRQKGGSLVEVECTAAKLPYGDQGRELVFVRDITERRRAEEALRESEKHYRSLFDNMLNGFAYCQMIFEQGRPEDFIYLKVNQAFEALTGLKNVTGKKVSEVIPGIKESDPELFEIYGRVALTGIPEHFETYVEVLGMWFAMAVYSPRQDYFVAVFDVITERKRAEAALRESEARFRGLFDNMTEGVALHDVIYDDHGEAVDYRILSTNPAFEIHTGLKAAQVRGQLASATYGAGAASHLETYAQVARSGQPVAFEAYFPQIQRHFHISVTSPKPGQFVTVFEDITERQQLAEALRNNEQFLTDIFDSIQDGLSVLDADLNVLRVNPAMEKFGYPQPMVGRKCYEVYHSQGSPCEDCPTQETLRTGKACRKIVTRHPANSGERSIEIVTHPLKDPESGQVRAVIEYVRDVTEQKHAEAERLRFGKLESLAILAGGIAHDFNNILTGIMGNISLAMLEQPEKGSGRERLTAAERACLQAQTLARQLLTFAKGGAPIKELISFEKLVAEAASFAASGSQARGEFSFPANLWAAEADPGQLSQVFQNLVINAIQAMPAGGTIKVRGENLEVGEGSDLPLDPGRYVKISIQDQGIGIPVDFLPKIFDPYFSTKQAGSGLGLATVYSIVHKHRGHIAVESKLGEGTTFQVYLPAVEGEASRRPEADRQILSGHGKILVMDDEEVVRDLLKAMLDHLGYQATLAKNGNEAIELFTAAREAGEQFAALILDLTVPGGMGGKAAIEKLLQIDPRVKAIVSSGYSEDPVMADFEKNGFSGVITKPYRVAELSRVLNRVLHSQSGASS